MGFTNSKNNKNKKQKVGAWGPCSLFSSLRPGLSSGPWSVPAFTAWDQRLGAGPGISSYFLYQALDL